MAFVSDDATKNSRVALKNIESHVLAPIDFRPVGGNMPLNDAFDM
jgi:hypothetical protein